MQDESVIMQHMSNSLMQATSFIADTVTFPENTERNYRSVYLLQSSVVEALVFLIVKRFTQTNTVTLRARFDYSEIQKIPMDVFEDRAGHIGIYRKTTKAFSFDEKVDFNTCIEIGGKYKLFSADLVEKLTTIRQKRNYIHIQARPLTDAYTTKDVDFVSGVTQLLFQQYFAVRAE